MLIGSLLSPSTLSPGDYWYSYADRDLYMCVPAVNGPSGLTWQAVPSSRYMFNSPPTGPAMPPIYIDANDLNRVPHQYNPSGGNWIPLVPSSFTFPPALPVQGDIWQDPLSYECYLWTGSYWCNISPQAIASAASSQAQVPFQFNSSSQVASLTIPAPGTNYALEITGLVRIKMDGTLEYSVGYSPDLAAVQFWEAMALHMPTDNKELAMLRAMVEEAKDAGFKFRSKKVAPLDPNAAWDAAMGVIG